MPSRATIQRRNDLYTRADQAEQALIERWKQYDVVPVVSFKSSGSTRWAVGEHATQAYIAEILLRIAEQGELSKLVRCECSCEKWFWRWHARRRFFNPIRCSAQLIKSSAEARAKRNQHVRTTYGRQVHKEFAAKQRSSDYKPRGPRSI